MQQAPSGNVELWGVAGRNRRMIVYRKYQTFGEEPNSTLPVFIFEASTSNTMLLGVGKLRMVICLDEVTVAPTSWANYYPENTCKLEWIWTRQTLYWPCHPTKRCIIKMCCLNLWYLMIGAQADCQLLVLRWEVPLSQIPTTLQCVGIEWAAGCESFSPIEKRKCWEWLLPGFRRESGEKPIVIKWQKMRQFSFIFFRQ